MNVIALHKEGNVIYLNPIHIIKITEYGDKTSLIVRDMLPIIVDESIEETIHKLKQYG